MKSLFSIVFLVFAFKTSVFTQVYTPFPTEGTWYQEHVTQDAPDNKRIYNYTLFIKGDTTFQGQKYFKLYQNYYRSSVVNYKGALRESLNKEVFYRESTDTTEKLMYKFGLVVGDSLSFPLQRISKNVKVLAIDSVSIKGSYRKRYLLNTQTLGIKDYWIEGIGSTKGLFYTYRENEFENTETLLCFENKNGVVFKSRNDNQECFLSSLGNEFNTQNNIKIYPNPLIESAIFETPLSILGDFQLFDITGKLLRNEPFVGTSFEFHRKGLSAGIYVFKISEGGKLLSVGKLVVQ
jgi:hypothetical protein